MKPILTRILALLALLLCTGATLRAAYPQHLRVTTPQGATVTVVALNENVLKVINTPAGTTATAGGKASVLDETSLGRCLNPDGGSTRASMCGLEVSLRSSGELTINGGPGKEVTDNGLRSFANGRQSLSLTLSSKAPLFGAGERGHSFDLRGDTLVMYNRPTYGYTDTDPRISQMNITMPLFLDANGYAVVFDDFGTAEMILGDPVQYITETKAPVSWYYINGATTLADVTTALTSLTGRQNLPPLWALGYITSKYGYRTQAETEGVIDSLQAAGYPVDGIVLDLYWYGKEQDMGRLAWEPSQWPDPQGMMRRLKDKNVNLVTITQPYVLRNGRAADNYNTLAPLGIFLPDSTGNPAEVKIWVGEGGMFDVSNPKTREWLTERYRQLTELGVGGWWGDLGEPEVHPDNGIHANGLPSRLYHNVYGNDWSQIVSDLYKNNYPDRRLMSLMRGGTTGLQRFDVFPWSGDVSRSWGGMRAQVPIMLNMGLSGLGYMGHDVGGFALDRDNPVDPELYIRWLQLGLFSPVLRTHATHMAEPYHYTEQADIILPLVRERYRWLPYNYTLAWENATKGWPLVRPLGFHNGTTEKYADVRDQYLWGRDIMVAPVMQQGATSRTIIFPEGDTWVDMANTARTYAGGTTVTNYDAPLAHLPLFVRSGSFIPQADYAMTSTADYNPSQYTIRFFPAENARTSSTIFEDTMRLPSSVTGNAGRVITLTGDTTANSVQVTLSANGTYEGADTAKQITLVIEQQTRRPAKVTVNGRKTRFTYSSDSRTLSIPFTWKIAKDATVTVTF